MNTRKPTGAPISLSPTMKLVDNQLTCSIQKKHDSSADGRSPHHNSRNVDLKKFIENSSCSFPDDMTAATVLTSFSSFGDCTTASLSTKTNGRGSILKSPSSINKPKVLSPSCVKRSISFSAAPAQVFTIENKAEYFDDMFYDEESLADFRYQALMQEAGMVDENGTPKDVLESANETNDKFRNIDELNGSLDFDELLLGDDSKPAAQNQNGSLVQGEEDRLEKKNGRSAIQDLEGSMNTSDQKFKSTGNFFCNLQNWDGDFEMDCTDDDMNSDGEDDELDENLDRPFSESNIGIPKALSSKEKAEGQRGRMVIQGNKKQHSGCIFGNSSSSRMDGEDDGTSEPSQRSSTYDGRNQQSLKSLTSEDSSLRSQRSNACDGNRQRSRISVAYDGDSQRSERSVPYNDEGQLSRRSGRETSKSAKVRISLTSLSDIFSSTRSLDVSDHKTENGEGDKRARLMAKMKGLRESLRSIQSMQNIDSDDDSDGGSFDQEEGVDDKIIDGIDTKNLERSLITKHRIYSPKPNGNTMTLERLESVKELSVPEI